MMRTQCFYKRLERPRHLGLPSPALQSQDLGLFALEDLRALRAVAPQRQVGVPCMHGSLKWCLLDERDDSAVRSAA